MASLTVGRIVNVLCGYLNKLIGFKNMAGGLVAIHATRIQTDGAFGSCWRRRWPVPRTGTLPAPYHHIADRNHAILAFHICLLQNRHKIVDPTMNASDHSCSPHEVDCAATRPKPAAAINIGTPADCGSRRSLGLVNNLRNT